MEEVALLTVQMLEEGSVRCILENQHPVERLVFMAISDYIQKVLVVHLG